MAASYPSSIKTFVTKTDKVDLVMAAHINDLQLEVVATETELGTDVAGSKTDLKTRLAVCLGSDGALNKGTSNPGSGTEGELFYRTDEDIVYIWDGSAWDTVGVFVGYSAGGDLTGTYPNPTIAADKIPKVIFTWSGNESYAANDYGMNVSTTQNLDVTATDSAGYINFLNDTTTYKTFLNFKFKKVAGVDTVTIYARIWADTIQADQEAILNVDIGGASNTVKSTTSTSPAWVTAAAIDVSGLTDGTIYDGIVQIKNEKNAFISYCSAVTLIGS